MSQLLFASLNNLVPQVIKRDVETFTQWAQLKHLQATVVETKGCAVPGQIDSLQRALAKAKDGCDLVVSTNSGALRPLLIFLQELIVKTPNKIARLFIRLSSSAMITDSRLVVKPFDKKTLATSDFGTPDILPAGELNSFVRRHALTGQGLAFQISTNPAKLLDHYLSLLYSELMPKA